MLDNVILDRRAFQFFCVLFPAFIVLLFLVLGQELPGIKYLAVMLVGVFVFSVLVAQIFSLNFAGYVVCFVVFTPLLVWVNSVLFIDYEGFFVSLSSAVLMLGLPLTVLVGFRFLAHGKVFERDSIFYVYFLWCALFLVLTASFVFFEEYSFSHYFLDEFSVLVLMTNLILLRVKAADREQWRDLFLLMMKYLLFISFCIIVVEILTRSNGNPLNFLNGARRLYSGTSGDVTGGFGEPVTMGLFGAVIFIVALQQRLGRLLIGFSVFLVVFSVGRSPMLIMMIAAFVYIIFHASISRRILLMPVLGIVCYVAYVIYVARLGGVDDMRYVGGIGVDYNLYLYLQNVSNYMVGTFFEEFDLIVKFVLFPLMAGVLSNQYVEVGMWFVPFLKGAGFCLIYVLLTNKKELWFKFSVASVFGMIFYYGAFTSTVFYFFNVAKEPVVLGYVPRETPLYFMVYAFFAFALSSRDNARLRTA